MTIEEKATETMGTGRVHRVNQVGMGKVEQEDDMGIPRRQIAEAPPSVTAVEERVTYSTSVQTGSTEDDIENRRDWEYLAGPGNVNIKHSLKRHLAFWKQNLKPSSFVLNVLSQGYILPLTAVPPKFYAENNKSSLKHREFVEGAIKDLLKGGLVAEVGIPPHCCNPLTVSEKGGKLRLVIDLRHVNSFLKNKKFRYEDLRTFAEIVDQGEFFINFDLKSGYHHVDIHEDHQQYLGFKWDYEEEGNKFTLYFVFTVLPFGLSTASYVFTKIMRPLAKQWRTMGIKAIIYLDDGIAAKKDKLLAEKAAKTIINNLTDAGFFINWDKSDFQPKQRGRWLGFVIDTKTLQLSVPREKLDKVKQEINNTTHRNTCTAKQLARIAGTISSMQPAIGDIVRLFTRNMYAQIEARASWYRVETPLVGTLDELHFWSKNIEGFNGCSFKPRYSTATMVFTDASDTGYGGFTVDKLGNHICTGRFSEDEATMSSTFRELLAVKLVLKSYGNLLAGQAIQVNIDNQAATRILSFGSTKKHLHKIALDVFHYSIKHDIRITPQWVQQRCRLFQLSERYG